MTHKQTHKQTQVRVSIPVYEWLRSRAKENNRSMNGELVNILLAVMQAEEKEGGDASCDET